MTYGCYDFAHWTRGRLWLFGSSTLDTRHRLGRRALGIIVALIAIALHFNEKADSRRKTFLQVMWLFWVVVPPVWFFVAYFVFFKTYGGEGTFEAFKYGQDFAAKLWFGVAAVLTVLVAK
jgi:ABC-type spermidine/putrescine transport system permease subunit II